MQQSSLAPQQHEVTMQFEILDEQVHQVDENSDHLRQLYNLAAGKLNQVKTDLAVYQSRYEHQQQLLQNQYLRQHYV